MNEEEEEENKRLIHMELLRRTSRIKVGSDEFKKLVKAAPVYRRLYKDELFESDRLVNKSMATWFRESNLPGFKFRSQGDRDSLYDYPYNEERYFGATMILKPQRDFLEYGVTYPDWSYLNNMYCDVELPVDYPEFGLSSYDMERAEVIGSLETKAQYHYDMCSCCGKAIYTNLNNPVKCMSCEDEEDYD